MKNILILTAVPVIAAIVGASIAMAEPMTLCAKKGKHGYVIEGHNANTTDWAANQLIGEAIGDGNCQSGWSLEANLKSLDGGTSSSRSTSRSLNRDTTTATVAAGRKTSTYTGTAPVVLKGTSAGAGDKWRLVTPDGNGGGLYRVVKPGNTGRTKGTTLTFTAQMLQDRDRNGNCTTNERWCRNFRYSASRDVTKTTTTQTKATRITHRVQVCPHSYDYIWRNMFGQLVAKVEQDIVPCQWKTVSTSTLSRMTQIGHSTYVSPKYIN